MNTAAVYEYEAIGARVAQLEAKRLNAPIEHAMQTAVENYLGAEASEPEHTMPYLGFDIYAPVYLAKA